MLNVYDIKYIQKSPKTITSVRFQGLATVWFTLLHFLAYRLASQLEANHYTTRGR